MAEMGANKVVIAERHKMEKLLQQTRSDAQDEICAINRQVESKEVSRPFRYTVHYMM